MELLSEYESIALKIISNWRKKRGGLLLTDELIGRVIRALAKADWKYDENKAKKSLYEYRQMWAIYSIREYLKGFKKPPKQNIDDIGFEGYKWVDYNTKAGKKIDFILKNCKLSSRERNIINLYLQGKSISQIAEEINSSNESCQQSYLSAVSKMKQLTNRGKND